MTRAIGAEVRRAQEACSRATALGDLVAAVTSTMEAQRAELHVRRRTVRRTRVAVRRARAALHRELDLHALHHRYARLRDPRLRALLVAEYQPNAIAVARRFADRGEPLGDLVQVAQAALVAALDRFDPDRGVGFPAFLERSVTGELKRHFRDRVWPVRVPRGLLERYLACRTANDRLAAELGRPPTPAEVGAALGLSEDHVLEAMEVGGAYRLRSLDAPTRVGDMDRPAHDVIDLRARDAFATVDADLRRNQVLLPLLEGLDPDDRRLVHEYFVEGRRQRDIAAQLGVSQVTVSRRVARILAGMRAAAAVADPAR